MLTAKILSEQEGRLWLGEQGEKLYGRANFRELYAVFSSPRAVSVMWSNTEVGTIESQFLETLTAKQPNAEFVLGGRAWQVVSMDLKRGICNVKPSSNFATAAKWNGGKGALGYELCQAMREVLVSDTKDAWWSARAAEEIATQRGVLAFLRDGEAIVDDEHGVTWWSFAGGRANLLLSRMLTTEVDGKLTVDDLRLSKFEPCLPPAMLDSLTVDRALDHVGAALAAKSV